MYPVSLADIKEERARVRRVLSGIPATTLNRRPPNGDWSIVENVRHLLFAEQLHLGGFLRRGVEWSPLGWNNRIRPEFAPLGTKTTEDIEKVLAEWDRIHRPIARAIRAAEKAPLNPDQKRALWRNHRHLRNHIKVIERLLRKFDS
jgi:hypothetical protein